MNECFSQLNWWKSDKCNAINGTDGTIWPPFVDKRDRLYFFVPDVCRYSNYSEINSEINLKLYENIIYYQF
jgi:hypothetical protein